MNKIARWLHLHYDRLIALVVVAVLFISLLYLGVKVGTVHSAHKKLEAEIAKYAPKYPEANAADLSVFSKAEAKFSSPGKPLAFERSFFVPESRVWCVDCHFPIPLSDDYCPFCKAFQPPGDTDGDGIPDDWEMSNGMNPEDASDAEQDMDGDKFCNYAEFEGKTDPRNKKSMPPVENELRLIAINVSPFFMRFKGKIILPDREEYLLNYKDRSGVLRMARVKLNDSIMDYTVKEFKEAYTTNTGGGGSAAPKQAHTLTLQKGNDNPVVLEYDKEWQPNELQAVFLFKLENREIRAMCDDKTFELLGQKYKLLKIDRERDSVVIIRLHDGKEIVKNRFPGTEPDAGQGQGDQKNE